MSQITLDQALRIAIQRHQAGQLPEAEAIYRQILAAAPNHFDALHLLGVLANQAGHRDAAIDLIRKALAIAPNTAPALSNLGNILNEANRFEEAADCCRRALELQPNFAEAANNLGMALQKLGKLDEAADLFSRAMMLRPNYPEAHNNLGNMLGDQGRYLEAVPYFRRALDLQPMFAEAHNNLGNALLELGDIAPAIACFERAIHLKRDLISAHHNLGRALADDYQFEAAIIRLRHAVELSPNDAGVRNDLAGALHEMGRHDEALAELERAALLDPKLAVARSNLGQALLLRGDYARGWAEYEWRWGDGAFISARRQFVQLRWDGSDLDGRTILIHFEQGLGDTILFARYLHRVAARGGRVVLLCQPELVDLMRSCAGVAEIITESDPLPPFDVHCPMGSLPLVLKEFDVPATVLYLFVGPELIERWAQRLGPKQARLRVGLNWAGNPAFVKDRLRSLRFDQLKPILSVRDVDFVSLQKGEAADQALAAENLTMLGPELLDFSDTAAVMMNLDLVITTDTSVPALAGVLGRPAWTMLRATPDWRWMLGRDDSPWYPTVRLFRQRREGDWETVIQNVADALAIMMNDDV